MKLNLKIWRQDKRDTKGHFVDYSLDGISEEASFLEMLDTLNESLVAKEEEPLLSITIVAKVFVECVHWSSMVSHMGQKRQPRPANSICVILRTGIRLRLSLGGHEHSPVVKDLVTDRSAFDSIMQAGGFITARTGSAVDANEIPIPKDLADTAMDAAACIGCGACVAACPNASAMLFTGAKVSHLNSLPQGLRKKNGVLF